MWIIIIFADLYRLSKDSTLENESYTNYVAFSKNVLNDQFNCTNYPEHSLLYWLSGEPPNVNDLCALPSTSTSTGGITQFNANQS